MSLFDYPRINITGTLDFSPATANNDDFSNGTTPPLALFDSANVMAITNGMDDAMFRAWVQAEHSFVTPQGPQMLIPAEWNYYGDLGMSVNAASVVGVVTGPQSSEASSLIGASLAFSGSVTDVNSQGSPPATQFFIPQLTLTSGSTVVLQGPASKGACQWINFVRNVNETQDQGGGGYIYHVLSKAQCSVFNLPGFDQPGVVGAIFRYYLFNGIPSAGSNPAIVQLYQQKAMNPITLQFVATIAPLFDSETITTGPVGRLLAASSPTIPAPGANNNAAQPNGQPGPLAFAPAMVQTSADNSRVSVELVGTFPDNFLQAGVTQPPPEPPIPDSFPNPNAPYTNDKWDFGPMTLKLSSAVGDLQVPIGAVDYANTDGGNALGWIFDFDISTNVAVRALLENDREAFFLLDSAQYGTVLTETDYFIATNQLSIYAEQHGADDSFLNQGTLEPATISVYRRGNLCPPASCPPIFVWSYATVPLQTPGTAQQVNPNFVPGDALVADVSQPGNINYVFTFVDQPPAPTWQEFIMTILTSNTTTISLRILPNAVDFTPYYTIVNGKPVGNSTGPNALTFSFLYTNVLQTYYLLFPVMDQFVVLNSEQSVKDNAQNILDAIDPSGWMTPQFMPRTRDMSQSRRTLLEAYCNMVLAQS